MGGHSTAIAVCMIVKDGVRTIERAIGSVRPFVAEIDVYDTGSTDGTQELVEHLAAEPVGGAEIRLRQGEWRDSFAWAREQSFAMASPTVEWLLYLDADEEIMGAAGLPAIVREAPAAADVIVFYWDIDRDVAGNTVSELWRDRMVRRSAGFRWHGAAHTALVPPAGHQTVPHVVQRERAWFVHHREEGTWHPARALRLLLAEVEQRGIEGVDDDTLFNLGNELFWRGEFERAAEYYEHYLARPTTRPAVQHAHAVHCLATAVRASGDPVQAERLELVLHHLLPTWPETLVGLMEAAVARDDWAGAAAWARRALEAVPPPVSPIRDPLRLRVLPHLRLAEASLRKGEVDAAAAALAVLREVVDGDPFVDERLSAFAAAADAADLGHARRLLHGLVGHYDEVVQAEARRIWLQAEPSLDVVETTRVPASPAARSQ